MFQRGVAIKRLGPDRFSVKVTENERDVLGWLVPQLRELLLAGEMEPLRRLFPNAHPDDHEAEAAYRELVHDDLLEQRLAALDTVESCLDAPEITLEQLEHWMHAVNGLRLVLGTRLDIGADADQPAFDADDPDLALWIAYDILTFMLGRIVDVLH